MLTLLIGLLLTAILVWIAALVLPGLSVDNFGSAILAALVLTVFGWLSGWVVAALPLEQFWAFLVYMFVVNVVGLLFAGLLISGVRISGTLGVVAAAMLITTAEFLLSPVVASLLHAASRP